MMVISGNIVFGSPMVMCSVSAAGSSSKPVVALQMKIVIGKRGHTLTPWNVHHHSIGSQMSIWYGHF